MKIRISFTVEVDADGWRAEYGLDGPDGDVRNDVRDYLLSLVDNSPAATEAGVLTVTSPPGG